MVIAARDDFDAAIRIMKDGFFEVRPLEKITAEEVFNALIERLEE